MSDNVFCTSYLLYNTKGFSLHKAKKNNISSTFKFKSKIHQARNLKQTTLPYFQEKQDIISDQLHRNAKQKLNECRKFRSLNLASAKNIDIDDERYETTTNRYEYHKISSVTLQPCFPQIDKKKSKGTSKSFRQIQQNKLQQPQESLSNDRVYHLNITRTLENNHLSQVNEQIQDLITKQILKTENQVVLKQGKIKFDETQVKMIVQSRRKSNNTTKRKKKSKDANHCSDVNRLSKQTDTGGLQVSAIKSFSPMKATKINFDTFYVKERKQSNDLIFPPFKAKHLKKVSDQSQLTKGVGVIGWENENISESSDVGFDFKQKQTEIESNENHKRRD